MSMTFAPMAHLGHFLQGLIPGMFGWSVCFEDTSTARDRPPARWFASVTSILPRGSMGMDYNWGNHGEETEADTSGRTASRGVYETLGLVHEQTGDGSSCASHADRRDRE